MNIQISFDHQQQNIMDAVMVNNKSIASITQNQNFELDEQLLLKIQELFKKSGEGSINSEMIVDRIADNYMHDENEMTIISVLAGAKAYSLSSEIRTTTLQMILRSEDVISKELEKFVNSNSDKNRTVLTLMTVGMILAATAETLDALDYEKEIKSFLSPKQLIVN